LDLFYSFEIILFLQKHNVLNLKYNIIKVAFPKGIALSIFLLINIAWNGFAIISIKASSPIANFSNFNTEQGLALSSVSCGFMDSSGNLWFGTYGGGVSRFDGKNFTNFTNINGLSHNTIWSISEDKFGNIWFGTDGGGATYYDGFSFKSITTNHGLPHNTIWYISPDSKGDLWFGTYGGAAKLRMNEETERSLHLKKIEKPLIFKYFDSKNGLANDDVRYILEDKSGCVWFGTYLGLSVYDGNTLHNYTKENGGLVNSSVLCITQDFEGNVWIGTEGGVSRVSEAVNKSYSSLIFDNYTTGKGLANNRVREIIQDDEGNLWFGTIGGGVSVYNGKNFQNYSTKQGLAHNSVRSLTRDNNGNIWIGTLGGGLSRYNGSIVYTYTSEQGLVHDRIFSVVEDSRGNLWFGTVGKGVSKFDGAVFSNYTTDDGLANSSVYSILEDSKRNIWFGTFGGGISKFDGKKFVTYTDENGLAHNRSWRLAEDKQGNIWVGTYGGGVSKFDGKNFTNYTIENGLAHNTIESIIQDFDGNMWFGTVGGGVSQFDGQRFITFTTANGIAHNRVRCMVQDKFGSIWMGTDAGLSRFDGKSFISYTTEHGMPSGVVYHMVIDNDNVIWIGTNQGFSGLAFVNADDEIFPAASLQVDNETLRLNYTAQWNNFNNRTGYPIKDINTNAMCITKVGLPNSSSNTIGEIWAGCGDDRVIRFKPRVYKMQAQPPRVEIQRVKIDEQHVCWHTLLELLNKSTDTITARQNQILTYGRLLSQEEMKAFENKFSDIRFSFLTPFYSLPQKLVLPYRHNSITFEYNAIETGKNFLVLYQYILEGQDKTWRAITSNGFVTFGNLREGEYTFWLKAQSPDGVWSDPINFRFKVLSPWWRTWWMYFTYLLLLFAIFWLLIKWRINRLEAEKRHLEQLVKDRTSELLMQKEEAERQKALVEDKNEEIATQHEQLTKHHKAISDSISYAQWLQMAILPSLTSLQEGFNDVFVLYRPKDVVSGDFYWMEYPMEQQEEDAEQLVYLAVADCTGHGVPGALISVVCHNALNRAIKEFRIQSTGRILDKVNELVVETFERSGMDIHEGMDIALCAINLKTLELQYSGACLPMYVVSKNNQSFSFSQVKPTPRFIGKWELGKKLFDTNVFKLNKGDFIYLSTDGIIDQFGGDNEKKFTARYLKEIILSNIDQPLDLQKQAVEKAYLQWKGDFDQTDDICMIGVKL
jgi:ligand-binding sensor domain-containing protein/serine phosphatase RsbU (regulator of sigma subunit)